MFLTSIFQTTWAQDSLHRETSVQVSRQSVSISDVFESNCEVHYLVAIRWSIDCRLHETSSASPPMAVFLLLIHLFIHIETTGLIFGENAEDQNVWIPQLDSQQAFQQWHDSTKVKKTAWRHNWTQNICQPTTIQCFGVFFLGPADVLSQNELPLSGPAPLRWKGSEDGCADTRPQCVSFPRRTRASLCCHWFYLKDLDVSGNWRGTETEWPGELDSDSVEMTINGSVWMWRSVELFVILSYWCWCINNWKHLVRRLDVWKFDRIL